MADNRIKTTIELKVDDRDVRNLNKTVERAFDEKSVKNFERAIERSTRAMAVLSSTAIRAAKSNSQAMGGTLPGPGRGAAWGNQGGGAGGGGGDTRELIASIRELTAALKGQGGKGGGGGGGGESFASRTASTGLGTYLGNRASQVSGAVGTAFQGSGMMSQMANAIPIIGPAISGAISGIMGFYETYAQQQIAQSQAVGTTGRKVGGFKGDTAKYGFDAGQAPGVMAGFAGQAQLSGRELTNKFAKSALEYQMLGGIGNAASIVGAARTSGGQAQSPEKLMAQAVSAGIRAGIKDSKLSDYMSQVAGWTEQTRAQGFNIAPESVLQLIEGYSKIGLRGEAAIRSALTAAEALRAAGKGSSPQDMMALMGAGYGRGKSYFEARKTLEQSPEKVVPQLLRMMGQGGSKEGRMFLIEQMFPGGKGLPVEVMEALASGDTSGFEGLLGTGESEKFMKGRKKDLKGAFSAARQVAGMSNRRGATGGKVAGAATAVQNADMKAAETLAPGMAPMVESAANFISSGLDAFANGTLADWGEKFASQITEGITAGIKAGLPEWMGGERPKGRSFIKYDDSGDAGSFGTSDSTGIPRQGRTRNIHEQAKQKAAEARAREAALRHNPSPF